MFLLKRFLEDCEDTKAVVNNIGSVNDSGEMNDNEKPSTSASARCQAVLPMKRIQGRVTLIDHEYNNGVIDNKYRFDLKTDVSDGRWKILKHGMKVSFVPRTDPNFGFDTAVDIMPIEQRGSQIEKNSLVLKVIKVEQNFVLMGNGENDTEPIKVGKQYLPARFAVSEGDWLKLRIQHEDDGVGGESRPVPAHVAWVDTERKQGNIISDNCILSKDTHEKVYYSRNAIKSINQYQSEMTTGQEVTFMAIKSDREEETSFRGTRDNVTVRKKYKFTKRALAVWTEGDNFAQAESDSSCSSDTKGKNRSFSGREQDGLLLRNKNKIVITPLEEVYFGNVVAGSSTSATVTIENRGSDLIILQGVDIQKSQSVCEFHFPPEVNGAVISPRVPFDIKIHCDANELGRTKEMCMFDFGKHGLIGRYLCVTSTPPDEDWMRDAGGGGGIHWRRMRQNMAQMRRLYCDDKNRMVIPGPKMFRAPFFSSYKLEAFDVPDVLHDLYLNEDELKLKSHFPINFEILDPAEYGTRFQLSVWFEELARHFKRLEYDMTDVVLHPCGERLMLEVPLLDEMVPPVLVGDEVECIHISLSEAKFTASVEKISHSHVGGPKVYLKFNESFRVNYRGDPVDRIRFTLGRTVFRRQHFAIRQAKKYLGTDWLFPKKAPLKAPRLTFTEATDENAPLTNATEPRKLLKPAAIQPPLLLQPASNLKRLFNSNVQVPAKHSQKRFRLFNKNLNEEQRNAVRGILAARGRPLPYIIYGPPGTGKTVTVVEAILQTFFGEPTSRILVAVPSNAGADLITERLVTTGLFEPKAENSATLVRLIGFLRSESDVPTSIVEYCEKGTDLAKIATQRLIVCTVTTAGQFFQLSADTAHFSHVFVDEAGFCVEPEALIPCVLAAVNKEAVIVLVGDHHQLGPVLINIMELNKILEKSLLERLMETEVYRRDEVTFPKWKYNPALVTKLVRSYRSHEALLKVPSDLFYDGELVSNAPSEAYEFDDKNHSFMAKSGMPLTFHGVKGNCRRDMNSPSWYNLEEVAQVVKYVQKMKACGIAPEDIGVITPYRKQAYKIRTALCNHFVDDEFKIASVQEFQGGEKKVIIISTVRSDYDEEAVAQKLPSYEFLYSPKLFNTAITRAKAFLVIVGNPYVLQRNPHWNHLLEYCVDLGVYIGCDLKSQLSHRFAETARRADGRARSVQTDSSVYGDIADEPLEDDGYPVNDNLDEWALW